jgi:DNA-binding IscR family transcriptional regulator
LQKRKHFVKFLESILLLLRHSGFAKKEGKGGGYYLIKIEGNQYGQGVSYFEGPIALLPCASHNFYEKMY